MKEMFLWAPAFNQPLGSWRVDKVIYSAAEASTPTISKRASSVACAAVD